MIFKESANCLSVYLFVPFHVLDFEAYFAPNFPKSDVQNLERFGILGEKCWKEVVSELNIFVEKWSKIAA